MVHGLWFVVTDLVDMMREIAYFTERRRRPKRRLGRLMSFGGKARREEARRSQKRENLSTLRKQKVSHVESANWEEKAHKEFDAWFFAQSKKSQADLREQGVIPYREMPDPRRKTSAALREVVQVRHARRGRARGAGAVHLA